MKNNTLIHRSNSFFKKATLAILLLGTLAFANPLFSQVTWTGTTSDDWNTASNWDSGNVPSATDDIIIPDTTINPIVKNGTNAVAKSVDIEPDGQLDIENGADLTIANASDFGLRNKGAFNNSGTLNITDAGGHSIFSTSSFTNNSTGVININNSGLLGIYKEGAFTNLSGGTINIDATVLEGIRCNGGLLNNQGIIDIDNIENHGILINLGTINNSGEMNIDFTANNGISTINNGEVKTINNSGILNIGQQAANSIGGKGISITAETTFNNNVGGTVNIDNVNGTGISMLSVIHHPAKFNNNATINIGKNGGLQNIGFIGINMLGTFDNNGSATIDIQNANIGLKIVNNNQYTTGVLTNSDDSQITISDCDSIGLMVFNNRAKLHNNDCAIILVDGELENRPGGKITNQGLFCIDPEQDYLIGDFTNDGVLKAPLPCDTSELVNNDMVITQTSDLGVIENVLLLGGANDFTAATTWYSNPNMTNAAGTYDVGNNSFDATGLSNGSHNLYFSVSGNTFNFDVNIDITNNLIKWTGSVDADWNKAGNWSKGAVPTATDDVIIPKSATYPIIMSGTAAVAKSVTVEKCDTLAIQNNGSLTIDGATNVGIKIYGHIANAGTVNVDNTGSHGIHTEGTGNCTNTGNINIGTNGGADNIAGQGLLNEGVFNNNSGGTLTINDCQADGIENIDTLENSGTVIIENPDKKGITNHGTFNNAGILTTNNTGHNGIRNKGGFTNTGTINVDNAGLTGASTNMDGIHNESGSFTNSSKINIGLNGGSNNIKRNGFFNNSTFNNNSGGELDVRKTSSSAVQNNIFFNNNSGASIYIEFGSSISFWNFGTVNNSGLITIREANVCFNNTNTFNNLTCGTLDFLGKFGNGHTAIFTNDGFFIMLPDFGSNLEGTLTNNGVLNSRFSPGIITNNEIFILKKDVNSCTAAISSAFTLGSPVDMTIDGVFTDEAATMSAGTYTVGTNTFTPNANVLDKGTETLYVKVTDGANSCSRVFDWVLEVDDNTDPVISGCPSNISKNNDAGECDAVATWTAPTATDDCDASPSISQTMGAASGTSFAVGTTTIKYTATDDDDNDAECSFTITVSDNEDPTISGCPSNISKDTDAGECDAVVTWSAPTASDNCTSPQSVSQTMGDPSGTSFAVGTTTIKYTATDDDDNDAECSFTITVSDNEDPIFSGCPSNISKDTDAGECDAVVTWTAPTTTDNCTSPQSVSQTMGDPSGSTFPVGVTTIKYTATDDAENESDECSFTVTVTDNEDPVISGCPSNISKNNDAGECDAVATWTAPTASDNCTSPQSVSQTMGDPSGSTFAIGTTTIKYTATDDDDNDSECSFTITVSDNEDPVISGCPSNISKNNDAGECTAVATWTAPTATDNCTSPQSISQTMGDPSGSTFAVGTTTIKYAATDGASNDAECSFTITVSDNEDPDAKCKHIDVQLDADGQATVTAADVNDNSSDACGIASVTIPPTNFDCSGVGAQSVVLTVTDNNDNTKTCTATVTVKDDDNPCCPFTDRIYVDIDATGNNDGTSWAGAFTDLQPALDGSCGGVTEIWVAEGTYLPTDPTNDGSNNRQKAFHFDIDLQIYGGFDGSETTRSERNSEEHVTILSGDIGTAGDNSDNSYHVVVAVNQTDVAVIDGFTIEKGRANVAGSFNYEGITIFQNFGGGLYCRNSAITISNCSFKNNLATNEGGAVSYTVFSATGEIKKCKFFDNVAKSLRGKDIHLTSGTAIISNNLFAAGTGSSVNLKNSAISTFSNCTFAVGGLINSNSTAIFNNCIYRANNVVINNGIVSWKNCNIKNSGGSGAGWNATYGNDLGGNIDADPLFTDPANIDFTLAECSPCINTGDNSLNSVTEDLAANPRVFDGTIDMGAYEYQAVSSICCKASPVLFVDASTPNNNYGADWNNAFATLEEALSLAASCSEVEEIWVADGTYYPTTGTDRTASFEMLNGIAIYGGFKGTETMLSERDWTLYPTILSGDIGNIEDASDNSYHVFFHDENGLDVTAILDGFIIKDGNADHIGDHENGGGMFNGNASPTVRDCRFENNTATRGGAMFNDQSGAEVEDCGFYENDAEIGGAVANSTNSTTKFTGCAFEGNTAVNSGGAVFNIITSVPTFQNCRFDDNSAGLSGGGIHNVSSSPGIVNCLFTNNTADEGAAMANQADACSPNIVNCTFSANDAGPIGGIIRNLPNSTPTYTNCIFWGNASNTPGTVIADSPPGATTVTYSIVEGSYPGTGNMDVDPMFTSPTDFHLTPCSPALGKGNNAANTTTEDLDGNTRIVGNIDLGAYEREIGTGTPVVWTGNGDGENWSDAANWDLGAIPQKCSDVLIPSPNVVKILTGEEGLGRTLEVELGAVLVTDPAGMTDIGN